MKLPALQTFNELDGEEIKEILQDRFAKLLATVPYLQRHLTIPRLRMSLLVRLEQYADQPQHDAFEISDDLTLECTVDASPSRGGHPPDQVRDEHGLAIPTPGRGARDIGAHIHLHDHFDRPEPIVLEGGVVTNEAGLEIDRTGTGGLTPAGMAKMQNATVVNMDQGPAYLAQGGERDRLGIFKNEKGRRG